MSERGLLWMFPEYECLSWKDGVSVGDEQDRRNHKRQMTVVTV